MIRLSPVLWLSLLLVSCDKQSQTHESGEKSEAPPKITKSQRPPSDASPEVRKKTRTALDEAKLIATPEEHDKSVAAIAWDNLELDPQLAIEAFQQLAPGSAERIRLIQHFAMRLAEQNLDEAVKWAESLATPEEKSIAYGRISLVLAVTDPARAANLISESGMAGREFDVAVVQVIQKWSATSPSDAAAWVVLFDPSEARSAGIRTVVSLWAGKDTQAALTWIGSLEDATLHQEAVAAMAEAILQQPASIQDDWKKLVNPEIRAAFEKLKQQAEIEVP